MDGATILIPETTKVSDFYLSREDFSVERLPTERLGSGHNVMLSKDAVANFHRLSPESFPLDRGQFAELPIVISDREEVDDIFENKGGWGALGASTIVHFSRIGFSCGGNQALVYRSRSCGRRCGTGDLVVLEKNGSKWQVVLTRLLWIS